MKKFTFTLTFLFFVSFYSTLHAQIARGRIFVGGQLSYNSSKQNNDVITSSTTTSIKTSAFIPYASYLVSDKIGLGLGLGYTQQKQDVTGTTPTGTNLTLFTIAPFVRYYFPTSNSGSRFYFYIQLKAAVSFGNSTNTSTTATTTTSLTGKVNTSDLALAPGFLFFPAKRWAFDFLLRGFGYNNATNKVDNGTGGTTTVTTTTFDIGIDMLSPTLGVVWFFK